MKNIFFLSVAYSVMAIFLISCTTFHLPAKSLDEFRGLMLPRVKYEYGDYLRGVPDFEGKGVVNLIYDDEGYMTSCVVESKEFPEAFKSRLCTYVFGKIRYIHTGDGELKAPLVFTLNRNQATNP